MKDIFNADEAEIFFKALPNKTLEFKGNGCKGTKLWKEMLIVLLLDSSINS